MISAAAAAISVGRVRVPCLKRRCYPVPIDPALRVGLPEAKDAAVKSH